MKSEKDSKKGTAMSVLAVIGCIILTVVGFLVLGPIFSSFNDNASDFIADKLTDMTTSYPITEQGVYTYKDIAVNKEIEFEGTYITYEDGNFTFTGKSDTGSTVNLSAKKESENILRDYKLDITFSDSDSEQLNYYTFYRVITECDKEINGLWQGSGKKTLYYKSEYSKSHHKTTHEEQIGTFVDNEMATPYQVKVYKGDEVYKTETITE